jgi:hypothetical protein
MWHYDEHPREVAKLLIYLTDVEEGTAPFEYLVASDGRAVIGRANPLKGGSRISNDRIDAMVERGCTVRTLTGPQGTMAVFDDNIVHRATLAARRHRDVLTLQVRPARAPRRPFVDARWTGSFPHRAYNVDPNVLTPTLW